MQKELQDELQTSIKWMEKANNKRNNLEKVRNEKKRMEITLAAMKSKLEGLSTKLSSKNIEKHSKSYHQSRISRCGFKRHVYCPKHGVARA